MITDQDSALSTLTDALTTGAYISKLDTFKDSSSVPTHVKAHLFAFSASTLSYLCVSATPHFRGGTIIPMPRAHCKEIEGC